MTLFLAFAMNLASASSHREAPAIALDPAADLTDFYMFLNPNDPSKVVFILNVNPFETPGGGPNFHRFDDSVTYRIHVDNEGDGIEDITYGFRFRTSYAMPGTFLYNVGDISNPANLNHMQLMDVARFETGMAQPAEIIAWGNSGLEVAPANVGVLSTPAGGYNPESSMAGTITNAHIHQVGDYRLFAGPRQESFYVDLERTFDLLNLGNVDNTNTLLGYNVHSIALEVPVDRLTRDGMFPSAMAGNHVIAAWATTARKRDRSYRNDGTMLDRGPLVQIARLGNPLVNEAVIPVGQKDLFNASHPSLDGQFLGYVTTPLLPVYMEALLGIPDPLMFDAGLGIGGREDLVLAFLTGHPALGNMPTGYSLGGPIPGAGGKVFGAFEALRLNIEGTGFGQFPDGRGPGDDIVDTALSALAGLLIDGTSISDGVSNAGLTNLSDFPFLGDPWAGDDHPAGFHDL